MNLNQTHTGATRRIAGRMALAFLMVTGAWSAWAAQGEAAKDAPFYDVAMVLTAGGETSTPRIKARAGEDVAISVVSNQKTWKIDMRMTPSGEDKVYMHATVSLDGKVVTQPVTLNRLNEPASIVVGTDQNFRLGFTIRKEQPAG